MRPVTVLPLRAAARLRGLVSSAGWKIEEEEMPDAPDVEGALEVAGSGRPVLFLPPGARAPRKLRRILVPHEGSPRVAGGIEAADEAAVASGAPITVLHVPAAVAPEEEGSLPAPRISDHGWYDWAEWRAEFLRRFCVFSEGVDVDLEVATGRPERSILEAIGRLRPDLVVLAWRGDAAPGRAATLREVADAASCPVLIVGDPGSAWKREPVDD